jgi:hypothetical protein
MKRTFQTLQTHSMVLGGDTSSRVMYTKPVTHGPAEITLVRGSTAQARWESLGSRDTVATPLALTQFRRVLHSHESQFFYLAGDGVGVFVQEAAAFRPLDGGIPWALC